MCQFPFGSSGQKTDRAEQLAAYGKADSTYNTLSNLGKSLSAAGSADTGDATRYFRSLLSGKSGDVMAAAAPEVSAIRQSGEAQKRELAQPGNRAGGTNQAKQGIQTSERGQVADVINRARDAAAGKMGQIGTTETGQGATTTAAAGSLADAIINSSTNARALSQQIHEQAVRDWSRLIYDTLSGKGALTAGIDAGL
jgi:hypothetical protein